MLRQKERELRGAEGQAEGPQSIQLRKREGKLRNAKEDAKELRCIKAQIYRPTELYHTFEKYLST